MLSVNRLSFDRNRIFSTIHSVSSSGVFLLFCLGKQSENNEALSS